MNKTNDDHRLVAASRLASEIVRAAGFDQPPISPFEIAEAEFPRLKLLGGDFGNSFDGQIEYHKEKDRFLIFYNTKYDGAVLGSENHPRTRFSVSHELGHFYIDSHRAYLMDSGVKHRSRSEFSNDVTVEREADHFAASLLMPQHLFEPLANRRETRAEDVEDLSSLFKTSLVSTAIRTVQLSHFPCALVGLRDGKVSWQFVSGPLKEGGCYPGPKGTPESPEAQEYWRRFTSGQAEKLKSEARAERWFRLYGQAEGRELWVTEYYIPVQVMDTVLILLSMSEKDLFNLR